MPFVPIPETAQVRMQFTYIGQQCENVYHVRFTGDPTPTDMVTIGELFRNWWDTLMQPLVSNQLSLNRVLVQSQVSQNAPGVEVSAGLPLQGGDSAASMPSGITLAVKWGTGLAGRSFRGRTFHLGLTETQCVNNIIGATEKEALRIAYDGLRTSLDNAALAVEFVVASRYSNNQPRVTGITTPISGVAINSDLDVQRRRMAGRGQ